MTGLIDALVLAVIVAGGLAVVLIGALAWVRLLRLARGRREPGLRLGRAAMIAIVAAAGTPGQSASAGAAVRQRQLGRLSVLSGRQLMATALALSTALSGDSRAALATLAEELGLVAAARRQVRSRWLARRLPAAQFLAALAAGGPDGDLAALLADPCPEVRLQATAWAVESPGADAVAGLVAMLDDPDGLCRFAAKDALIRIGLPVAPAIVQLLADCEAEQASPGERGASARSLARTEAALEVAASMADTRFAAPAAGLIRSTLPRIRTLAAVVLGTVADPASVPVIERLLDDAEPSVRAAALAALGRIGHWPAAPRVVGLLGDPSWRVRREAGLALLRLGAPGRLMLREARASEDRLAAGMAAQIMMLASLDGGLASLDRGRAVFGRWTAAA